MGRGVVREGGSIRSCQQTCFAKCKLDEINSQFQLFLNIFVRYLDPIFYGDYPETMRERLGEKLPEFSQKDEELLRNSLDFVGLNHYTTRFIVDAETNSEDNDVFYRVQGMERIGEMHV